MNLCVLRFIFTIFSFVEINHLMKLLNEIMISTYFIFSIYSSFDIC